MNLKIKRELTVYNIEEVMKMIKSEMESAEDHENLILDLTDIEDIDTAGLQMLVSLQKFSDANNSKCSMLITSELEMLFDKYGAQDVLEFEVNNG